MPVDAEAWLAHFTAVIGRVGGALAFVPLPAVRQAPLTFRIALAVILSLMISPVVARRPGSGLARSPSDALWDLPLEVAMGVGAGVAVGWIFEIFTLGMQLISVQAGYSYASTIDPTTEADSGVLLVAAQLSAGLLFVGLGWERHILGALAASFERSPPGVWHLRAEYAALAANWTATAVMLAFRLALPLMGFLLLLDLALSLMARTQPQLQLLGLALPMKMAATFLLLVWQAPVLPTLLGKAAEESLRLLAALGVGP